MRELIAGFQASLLWICTVVLLALAGTAAAPVVGNMLARLRKLFGKSKVQGVLAVVAICGLVLYGGSKSVRKVDFPRTDVEQAYLVDAGSYVTNDLVHLAFNALLVPQDAPIFLAYWPDGSTNEADIVTAYSSTLAEIPKPLDYYFENAISNRWYCYTTWTPGPAVHTNGVWQTIWMTDRRHNRCLIPIRARVVLDGETVAPPLPRQEEEDNNDE